MIKFVYKTGGKIMSIPIETERKFVISMPDLEALTALNGYSSSDIEQTYLTSPRRVTRRVRARSYKDGTVYTETSKIRVDRMSAFEDEREVDKEEYEKLLAEKIKGTVTLKKTRYTFNYQGRVFEVDVYPNWHKSCILEVELNSSSFEIEMPDFINVIEEVTGEKKYSNAAMSRKFPKELV